MERDNNFRELLGKTMLSEDPLFAAPPIETMRQARNLVTERSRNIAEREDYITLVFRFLNMRVRLYHVVLFAMLLWFCLLLTRNKPEEKQEVNNVPFSYGLASSNNSTVMCSIGTCKKN